MSKNICPRCGGASEYQDIDKEYSSFLCTGCEIEIYPELHHIMNKYGLTKEQAYQRLISDNAAVS